MDADAIIEAITKGISPEDKRRVQAALDASNGAGEGAATPEFEEASMEKVDGLWVITGGEKLTDDIVNAEREKRMQEILEE
jgi:hypothetical protein